MAENLIKQLLGLPDWDRAKVDLTHIADRTATVEYYRYTNTHTHRVQSHLYTTESLSTDLVDSVNQEQIDEVSQCFSDAESEYVFNLSESVSLFESVWPFSVS